MKSSSHENNHNLNGHKNVFFLYYVFWNITLKPLLSKWDLPMLRHIHKTFQCHIWRMNSKPVLYATVYISTDKTWEYRV